MIGILGKKLGMTQVFRDDGSMIGVTVIEAGPCPILAVKVKNIQVAFDIVDDKRLRKPNLGLFKKVNVTARKYVRELRRDPAKEYKVGEELKADLFKPGDFVDITGISIGKGFQGGMKRWHWMGGPESHGSTS
ncbi:MAG: 50S ribosomal protein L3, partial [Candidatus Omnitrophica bacterium]|nr:50S ribosomal protein L3 [Candidatus Omnitrophota bacterium]